MTILKKMASIVETKKNPNFWREKSSEILVRKDGLMTLLSL